jgi:hypothetical protein
MCYICHLSYRILIVRGCLLILVTWCTLSRFRYHFGAFHGIRVPGSSTLPILDPCTPHLANASWIWARQPIRLRSFLPKFLLLNTPSLRNLMASISLKMGYD